MAVTFVSIFLWTISPTMKLNRKEFLQMAEESTRLKRLQEEIRIGKFKLLLISQDKITQQSCSKQEKRIIQM